jgi:myosin heavy subunit
MKKLSETNEETSNPNNVNLNSVAHDPWENAFAWFATNPDGVWQRGRIRSHVTTTNENKWKFSILSEDDGKIIDIETERVDTLFLEFEWVKRRDKNSEGVRDISDMTSLSFLNEPEMIECMKERFNSQRIYTNTGPILLAVNPFERLPLYTDDLLHRYYEADSTELKHLGPHIYQISARAYKNMFIDKFKVNEREDQAILVNGESGAIYYMLQYNTHLYQNY